MSDERRVRPRRSRGRTRDQGTIAIRRRKTASNASEEDHGPSRTRSAAAEPARAPPAAVGRLSAAARAGCRDRRGRRHGPSRAAPTSARGTDRAEAIGPEDWNVIPGCKVSRRAGDGRLRDAGHGRRVNRFAFRSVVAVREDHVADEECVLVGNALVARAEVPRAGRRGGSSGHEGKRARNGRPRKAVRITRADALSPSATRRGALTRRRSRSRR